MFEFDAARGELRREGAVVKLAPQPARVLALLVSRPGEVILRDEFRRELWGDDTYVDFERGLNFSVAQVRTALGDAAENPRFVQTVPRRGYRFIAPVAFGGLSPAPAIAESGGGAPEPAPESPAGLAPERAAVRGGQATKTWVAAGVLVLIAGMAWFSSVERPTLTAHGELLPSAGSSPNQAPASVRVAVLPFTNLTGDDGLDYVVDGLTDELIMQLGSLSRERLAVIARTSVMAYRKREQPIDQIAKALDVQYIVEGSVRREGDVLRIAASLVPVHEQSATAWSNDLVEIPAKSVDSRQAAAAIRIARMVATELLADTAALAEPARVDPVAWDAFLQASAAIHRGTTEDIRTGIRHLEAAVTRDAGFAAAWARLAEARHMLVMKGAAAPQDVYPAAQRAAARAVAASPNLASAHVAQGLVRLWYGWRPDLAAASFERAIALNPSLAAAHHDYAWALVALGRPDEAVRHIVRSRDLDPISPRANNDVGWLHLFVREPERAARACERTLALDPAALEAQACLERAYAQQERFEAAVHAARATLPRVDERPAARSGREALEEIWRWRLQQLERAATERWVNPYMLAVHYAFVGDRDRALAALERAFAARAGMLAFVARDPAMDSLRGHPRFVALVAKVTETTTSDPHPGATPEYAAAAPARAAR